MSKLIDLTGRRFTRWLVLRKSPSRPGDRTEWECRCDCGTTRSVDSRRIRSGLTKSCGCLGEQIRTHHGNTKGGKITPEYRAWMNMKNRTAESACPANRKNYFDRGVRVCERWKSFENFLADMGQRPSPKHTLERKDSTLSYSPENCEWATRVAQNRNTSRNRILTYKGETKCVAEWAEKLGVHFSVIHGRLRLGYTTEEALETPKHAGREIHREAKRKSPRGINGQFLSIA